ncbi:hypothetical protein AB4I99_16335 [Citrobacter murliniae]
MNKLLFDDIVSDTLLIPLWMRAEESRRPDRLFEDKEAEELVKLLSVDFSKFENKKLTRVGILQSAFTCLTVGRKEPYAGKNQFWFM